MGRETAEWVVLLQPVQSGARRGQIAPGECRDAGAPVNSSDLGTFHVERADGGGRELKRREGERRKGEEQGGPQSVGGDGGGSCENRPWGRTFHVEQHALQPIPPRSLRGTTERRAQPAKSLAHYRLRRYPPPSDPLPCATGGAREPDSAGPPETPRGFARPVPGSGGGPWPTCRGPHGTG